MIVLAALLGAWAWLATARPAGRALVASPWATGVALCRDGATVAHDLAATLARAGAGLLVGTILGLAVGLVAAALVRRAPVLESALDVARSIPPVVSLPLLLLAVGYNDYARVGTVAAGCTWIVALAVTTAAAAPPSPRRELLALVGASRLEALRWTQPWEALGTLAVGLRTAASMAVVVAVVTEMIVGAEHGIGARLVSAQIVGDATGVTVDIVATGAAGWGINAALRRLESRARAFTA